MLGHRSCGNDIRTCCGYTGETTLACGYADASAPLRGACSRKTAHVRRKAGAMNDDGPTVRLVDVVTQLRRRWRVLAAAIGVCVVVALAIGLVRGPAYTATAVVTVNPIGESEEVNIATERAVVTSTDVAKRAAEIAGTSVPPTELVEHVSVSTPTDAVVLEIEASADEPARAATIANAFAQGYLQVRASAAEAVRDKRLAKIGKRIDALTATLKAELPANQFGNNTDVGPTAESIKHEIDSLRDTRSQLTAKAVNPGRVITKAVPPRDSSSLGMVLVLLGGAVVGLFLGVASALLRERTDRRIRGAERLGSLLDMPVMYFPPGGDSEIAGRLLIRMGLDQDSPSGTVAVLGTEAVSAESVGAALAGFARAHGVSVGTRPGQRPSPSPRTSDGTATQRVEADGTAFIVRAASSEHGIAQAMETARGATSVIVVAGKSARVAAVRQLIDELALVEHAIGAVVVVADADTSTGPPQPPHPSSESHGGQPSGSRDPSEEPTRFLTPANVANSPGSAGAQGPGAR